MRTGPAALKEAKPEGVQLRPLSLADMKEAMKQVGASVSGEAFNMSEMRQWNETYGEGGTRKATTLSYFM